MYGKMLQEILDEIEAKNGDVVYRTGLIGELEFRDIVASGKFKDEVNDSHTSKHISLEKLSIFNEKYGLEFSGVICLEEDGFKLYIDRIKGSWVMNSDSVSDVEWYESFKQEILDTFPGATTIDLNHTVMSSCDRVYVRIELSGMNKLFPETVYTCNEGSYHQKLTSPILNYHKFELGKFPSVMEDNRKTEEWIVWHEIHVGDSKSLLVTEKQIPLDCRPEDADDKIDEWIKDILVNQIFCNDNWIKSRIEDIFVASEDRLSGYTEFVSAFSERTFNEEGGINAHICILWNNQQH